MNEITAVVQALFYGVYILLFGICLHILLKKKKGCYKYHLLATTVLFLLASINMLLYVIGDVATSLCVSGAESKCWFPTVRFYDAEYETALASSAVADAILLWRCYTVWGRQRKIIILPVFLYAAGHVTGLVLSSSDIGPGDGFEMSFVSPIVAGLVGFNNILLSTLIAFRIFRISREVVAYLGPKSKSMYRMIIAVTLESGLLYSALLIVFVILYFVPPGLNEDAVLILSVCVSIIMRIWAPMAGIVSTVIIVRVTLGISLDDVESAIVSIRAGGTVHEEALVVDISQSTNGLTQQGRNQGSGSMDREAQRDSENSE
ncbi:hypothetical protein Moror_5999 [Moniliophthora roreri MCA 2997]|uniref:Integral membrane protein n=1 Tax=Moniliophthora roreri (strain MCA 2997) TaxID=1381753 RepID=V2WUR1_MONRO|nr:hypothetical protein Moror_5999 [Moniliophthora roreri MCA 2997]